MGNRWITLAERVDDKVTKAVIYLGDCFYIGDLARATMLDQDDAITACEPHEIQAFRRSAQQLMRVIRCVGWYLFVMTALYTCQTFYCLSAISPDDFRQGFASEEYAQEIYDYSLDIEWMKMVHSSMLLMLSVFLVKTTSANRLLTQSHYRKVLAIAAFVSIIYFVPCLVIGYLSYKDAGDSYFKMKYANFSSGRKQGNIHEAAMFRFADWMLMMAKRSDHGIGALLFSMLVHI